MNTDVLKISENIYQSDEKYYDQQQYKEIIKAAMVSTPKDFLKTSQFHMAHMSQPNNPNL